MYPVQATVTEEIIMVEVVLWPLVVRWSWCGHVDNLRREVDGGGCGVVNGLRGGDVDGVAATEAVNWVLSCGVEQPF